MSYRFMTLWGCFRHHQRHDERETSACHHISTTAPPPIGGKLSRDDNDQTAQRAQQLQGANRSSALRNSFSLVGSEISGAPPLADAPDAAAVRAARDSMVCAASPAILTVFSMNDHHVLHQNPSSIRYMGNRQASHSAATFGATEMLTAGGGDWPPQLLAILTERGATTTLNSELGQGLLEVIFCLDPTKLERLLTELQAGGVGAVWKGVVRVPPSLAPTMPPNQATSTTSLMTSTYATFGSRGAPSSTAVPPGVPPPLAGARSPPVLGLESKATTVVPLARSASAQRSSATSSWALHVADNAHLTSARANDSTKHTMSRALQPRSPVAIESPFSSSQTSLGPSSLSSGRALSRPGHVTAPGGDAPGIPSYPQSGSLNAESNTVTCPQGVRNEARRLLGGGHLVASAHPALSPGSKRPPGHSPAGSSSAAIPVPIAPHASSTAHADRSEAYGSAERTQSGSSNPRAGPRSRSRLSLLGTSASSASFPAAMLPAATTEARCPGPAGERSQPHAPIMISMPGCGEPRASIVGSRLLLNTQDSISQASRCSLLLETGLSAASGLDLRTQDDPLATSTFAVALQPALSQSRITAPGKRRPPKRCASAYLLPNDTIPPAMPTLAAVCPRVLSRSLAFATSLRTAPWPATPTTGPVQCPTPTLSTRNSTNLGLLLITQQQATGSDVGSTARLHSHQSTAPSVPPASECINCTPSVRHLQEEAARPAISATAKAANRSYGFRGSRRPAWDDASFPGGFNSGDDDGGGAKGEGSDEDEGGWWRRTEGGAAALAADVADAALLAPDDERAATEAAGRSPRVVHWGRRRSGAEAAPTLAPSGEGPADLEEPHAQAAAAATASGGFASGFCYSEGFGALTYGGQVQATNSVFRPVGEVPPEGRQVDIVEVLDPAVGSEAEQWPAATPQGNISAALPLASPAHPSSPHTSGPQLDGTSPPGAVSRSAARVAARSPSSRRSAPVELPLHAWMSAERPAASASPEVLRVKVAGGGDGLPVGSTERDAAAARAKQDGGEGVTTPERWVKPRIEISACDSKGSIASPTASLASNRAAAADVSWVKRPLSAGSTGMDAAAATGTTSTGTTSNGSAVTAFASSTFPRSPVSLGEPGSSSYSSPPAPSPRRGMLQAVRLLSPKMLFTVQEGTPSQLPSKAQEAEAIAKSSGGGGSAAAPAAGGERTPDLLPRSSGLGSPRGRPTGPQMRLPMFRIKSPLASMMVEEGEGSGSGEGTTAQGETAQVVAATVDARTVAGGMRSSSAGALPAAAGPAVWPSPTSVTYPEVKSAGEAVPECWHEVWATRAVDPATGADVLVLAQHDVTSKVLMERHIALVMETEHRLLEQLFPRHILAHITEEWSHEALRGGLGSRLPGGPAGQALSKWQIARDYTTVSTWHEEVTLLFADIKGFTPMCKQVEPRAVMTMLNDLYSRYDKMLDKYGVFKVETIGDCYFVAGGLMHEDEDGMAAVRGAGARPDPLHARKVFMFAKAMLEAARHVRMPTTGEPVQIRIGIATGPVVSGVVGLRMPRFCLFGDTVNTASRMESTGTPGAIHVSQSAYELLRDEDWTPSGGIEVKGKGIMQTYLWIDRPSVNPPPKVATSGAAVAGVEPLPPAGQNGKGRREQTSLEQLQVELFGLQTTGN